MYKCCFKIQIGVRPIKHWTGTDTKLNPYFQKAKKSLFFFALFNALQILNSYFRKAKKLLVPLALSNVLRRYLLTHGRNKHVGTRQLRSDQILSQSQLQYRSYIIWKPKNTIIFLFSNFPLHYKYKDKNTEERALPLY